jgi:uncharacterized protein YfaS (alpha-2-macroglobulin family)/tetratricopeptide (TPR) repeat protein
MGKKQFVANFYLLIFSLFCLQFIMPGQLPAETAWGDPFSAMGRAAAGEDAVTKAEDLLQAQRYQEAFRLLQGGPIPAVKKDYAVWLKALALFKAGEYHKALEVCLKEANTKPENQWLAKVRFLTADIYIQKKDFKSAQKIYREEAIRLLSLERKDQVAGVYLRFAEMLSYKPKADELNVPPPDYKKAYAYYKKALELEIGKALREKVRFNMARMQELAGSYGEAVQEYQQYLLEFDPYWQGMGITQFIGMKKIEYAGFSCAEARYRLAECHLKYSNFSYARQELEDLIKLLQQPKNDSLKGDLQDKNQAEKWRRLAMRRLPFTYRFPTPDSDLNLEAGLLKTADFLKLFPDDPLAVTAAWQTILALNYRGRVEQAVRAARDFIDKKGFRIRLEESEEEVALRLELGVKENPAEQFESLQKKAVYLLGQLEFLQKKYKESIDAYTEYTVKFPNGPDWTAAQRGILDAEYSIGIDLLKARKYDSARQVWEQFLNKYPLDSRSRQILFTLAEVDYQNALEAKKAGQKTEAENGFKKAVAAFKRLISKYPNTEESSLAQFRMGEILESELGDLKEALNAYRTLNWGSYAGTARQKVEQMVNKTLVVKTERIYRTNEKAYIRLELRNIPSVQLKIYKLDMADYFHKFHTIRGVETLDLSLISPDKQWEVSIPGYKDYLPVEQYIEIPMQGPAIYAVNVSEKDLEATTLVIRSDMEIIVKSSRTEVLVFAQNMLTNKGVADADVLITDGTKVILGAKTGSDGILLRKVEELKETRNLCVFVTKSGNMASNQLDLSALGFAKGLAPKGYIYTDRPAYRPGQTVKLRGIIRDIKEGSYAINQGMKMLCAVVDASGRIIFEDRVKLSPFGTFEEQVVLSTKAAQGAYTIRLRTAEEEKVKLNFQGNFLVEEFKIQKVALDLVFDKQIYFRGEPIKATLKASYYYGQPVADVEVRYVLPDRRTITEKTNERGELEIVFDTTPFSAGAALPFGATLVAENVTIQRQAYLASYGFFASVSSNRQLSLAGEPVEIRVETKDALGNPVSQELSLHILVKEVEEEDPLFANIPWLKSARAVIWAEKEERVLPLRTDESGLVRLTYTPQGSGQYVFRVKGKDRLGNIVTAESLIFVSGKEDKTALRLLAEQQHYKVGETASIRIFSRLSAARLALLTFEGEGVISYLIKEIKPGANPLQFAVGHEHFPNFAFSVAIMDGNKLQSAALSFTVERKLMVSIKPEKEYYEPGDTARIKVEVKDHQGKPVEAEFSLALVNQALFAVYPDLTENIVTFFQKGTERQAFLGLTTSCTFAYWPQTVQVVKEIALEEERLAEEEATAAANEAEYAKKEKDRAGKEVSKAAIAEDKMAPPSSTETVAEKRMAFKDGEGRLEEKEARKEESGLEGYWQVFVITDAAGTATLELPLPQSIGAYRLAAKGCTKETLVGENTGSLVVRKDFFAELKAPALAQEGDAIRLPVTVHNLTAYQGPVEAVLHLEVDGKKTDLSQTINVAANSVTEIVFTSFTVPVGSNIRALVEIRAGKESDPKLKDALTLSIPIRPWGLAFADQKSATAAGDSTVFLKLPPNKDYSDAHLDIHVGASINQELIDFVIGDRERAAYCVDFGQDGFPAQEPSELLALSALLSYLEAKNTPQELLVRVKDKVKALVSQLVSMQISDGSWNFGVGESKIQVTCLCHWALTNLSKQGIMIDAQILKQSETFLKNSYANLDQDDYDLRAMIMHALSRSGAADYSFVNRLYRNRNNLSNAALAYTALSLAGLEHKDMGLELVGLLETKAVFADSAGDITGQKEKPLYWSGKDNQLWERNTVETTALVLMAYEALKPAAPQVEQAVRYLIKLKGPYGYTPAKAKGVAVTALTAYYGKVKDIQSDYNLQIMVNDQPVGEFKAKAETAKIDLSVPASIIRAGENKIAFKMQGQGQYVYTAVLSAFSKDLKFEDTLEEPDLPSKEYIHENLTYKGMTVARSTMEISELEYGRTALVTLSIKDYTEDNYIILTDYFPAGAVVLKNTISGNYSAVQVQEGKVVFYFEPHEYIDTLSYQIAGFTPGSYKVLPPVLVNALDLKEMAVGSATGLSLLARGEKASKPYEMNKDELFGLGKAYFADGLFPEALALLEKLYGKDAKYNQPELARMLLWIRSEEEFYDAKKLVEYFEILKEKYPDLFIPFERILTIGRAYNDIGEYERSFIVYRATVEASFLKDAPVGGALEQGGEFYGSISFMHRLWQEYPDSAQVVTTYFTLAQEIYNRAPKANELKSRLSKDEEGKPKEYSKTDFLQATEEMLWRFMAVYDKNPLADDAAFTMVNISLDKKVYTHTVDLCRRYRKLFPASNFLTSFQYMEALGLFSLRRYAEAVKEAEAVATGESDDQDLATYILAQIYHTQRKPEQAITYYKRIKDKYPDAKEAIAYFEQKSISMNEVTSFKPGERAELTLQCRNISHVYFQVYKVDLMKLYLKEKNLSRITNINLSGITPIITKDIPLGKKAQYNDTEETIALNVKEEGAYLVICRGDDLFASGLVLITPLAIDVQEDPQSGRVRVNVRNIVSNEYADNVHVKVIGSENTSFVSGETDLRGIFIADGINGAATVIVRDKKDRYAFHRGVALLNTGGYENREEMEQKELQEDEYRMNLDEKQIQMREQNRGNLDKIYNEKRSGVQIQEAY